MHTIFPMTEARLHKWQAQLEVLGVLLVGSKSRGYVDEFSDDDLEVLLTDEAFEQLKPTECGEFLVDDKSDGRKLIYDAQYLALASLVQKISSSHDLDHWPYEKAQVLFDRDGRVRMIVETLGSMDSDFRHKRLLHATIDLSIAVGRAEKTLRRGAGEAAVRMLVARGAKALERVIFALEWCWVPLDHWMEKELLTLKDPVQAGTLLVEALKNGSPGPLREALTRLEEQLATEGVPRAAGRNDLFFELIHPDRAEERAIHGLH